MDASSSSPTGALADRPAQRLRTSRYNFAVQVSSGTLLYNANTGAVQHLSGRHAAILSRALTTGPADFPAESLDEVTREQFLTAGFLLPADKDEVAEVRERFRRARAETPIVLTLTTTMDCNLGCYYCYEERSQDRLELRDVGTVVALALDRLRRSGKRSLHVDWYGGEPLLNIEFLETASLALQALCEGAGVAYQASIISNGTCWPVDVGAFVRRHRLRQVQISFDGLRRNHDSRRRYRQGRAPGPKASAFDEAVGLVDRLLDHVRVDLRFNTDRGNRRDLLPFARLARSRGWFCRPYPAVLQPARVGAYSERSRFLRRAELSLAEFGELRARLRAEVGNETLIEESESPDGFPRPRTSVCAALADDSVVIGADGREYRCGLQVGEGARAVGEVQRRGLLPLPLVGDHPDDLWWRRFDPTELATCSRCSFLPICWGGCPKKHLEADSYALAEQGAYWRANLPRLIARGAGMELLSPQEFTESFQFRP
jgi:uncharacterized protein